MGIVDTIRHALGREDSPQDHAPRRRSHTSSIPRPPTGIGKAAGPAWYEKKPEYESNTHAFTVSENELAERISHRICTGRIAKPRLTEAARVLFVLFFRKDMSAETIAHVLQNAPDVPEELKDFVLTHGSCSGMRPDSAEAWTHALQQSDLDAVAHEAFALLIRDMIAGEEADGICQGMWEHALATAMVTDHLAMTYHFKNRLLAFLTALLHDIGQRVVYLTAVDEAKEEELPLRQELVYHLCKTLHEEAAERLLQAWRFPQAIVSVVSNHHGKIETDDRLASLRALIQLADQAVMRCGHAAIESPMRCPLIECSSARFLKLTPEKAESVFAPIPGLAIQATL